MIYDCDIHSCLWYLNFITIPSFVCPKSACLEYLISLHNDRHLFADGFVTVRPIAIKFWRNEESVSCLKFRKFNLNPTNFNRKWAMMFKLDLKNITLTAFRTPVQSGLMHFMPPPKIVQIGWGHHVNFCIWKKIGHYFWRRVYVTFRSAPRPLMSWRRLVQSQRWPDSCPVCIWAEHLKCLEANGNSVIPCLNNNSMMNSMHLYSLSIPLSEVQTVLWRVYVK